MHIVLIIFLAFPLLYLIGERAIHSNNKAGAAAKTTRSTQAAELNALESAQKNVLANPSYDTYLELGLQYYNRKQFQESIMATERAIEYNPDSFLAYNNLCAAYNELSLWDNAVEACQKALLLAPDFQLAKNNLNWAVQEKEKQKALDNK